MISHEKNLARLPEGVSTRDGAISTLQGLTVLTMIKETCEAKKGQYILASLARQDLLLPKFQVI